MPPGVDAQLVEPAINPSIMAILQPLEVAAHLACSPARVASQCRDAIPVRIMRIDQDHGIVGGTATQGPRSGIKHSVDITAIPTLPVIRIAALARVVAVVAYEEVPLQGLIFRSEGVKARHIVIRREP